MEITFRSASLDDIDAITALESRCFPPGEAADRKAFELRLRSFPQCFRLAEADNAIIAVINGMTTDSRDLTDEMYEGTSHFVPDGKWLMLFGVETAPEFRKQGVASLLMAHVIEQNEQSGRSGIVLTCKEELIPFYERFGFVSEGVSESVHGGAVWYQMRLCFKGGSAAL